jgi:aldehyde:ferredoxin oxidoreductase
LYGNWGKILFVDLTEGKITVEQPDESLYRDYLGGYGLGSRILFSRMKGKVDPLGPENMLGFVTGPLVGTPAITGTRFTVVGKSPLTGTWGDSNCGGYFGPALKMAGFDAVFFTGISPKPVYLWVEDGKVELRDADWLWGKDSYEVQDAVDEKLGKGYQVACIGPSGEKVSLLACIINDKGRAAGRSGLGAVMGSKKLKALVVKGTMEVPLADPEATRELRVKLVKEMNTPALRFFRKYGTINHVASSAFSNDSPVKNWSGVGVEDFPNAEAISDDNIIKFEVKKYGCWRCPIVCDGIYRVEEGPYPVEEVHKPEYETCGMFGSNLLNDNVYSLFKVNDICNRYGIDTISVGSAIGFAIECFEKGLITKEDTGGLELKWGDHKAIVELTELIAKREGFGAVLADGTLRASQKIGEGSEEYAIHVGGQELPAHDPRFAPSWGINYKLDATPGRHTQGGTTGYDQGRKIAGLDLGAEIERYKYEDKGKYHARIQNIDHAMTSLGICNFAKGRVNYNEWPKFLSLVTGHEYTLADFEVIGARIGCLRAAFNVREGIRSVDFKVPGRAYGYPPQGRGPLGDISLDMDVMTKDYYEANGWDSEGRPTKERLLSLGLDDVAEELYK